MSSWANLGLSALSNVTQSVQALSSYAQVVLHEAREEVESELLGEPVAPTSHSPPLEATAESAPDPPVSSLKSSAFSSRAQLISPPRLAAPKHRAEDEENAFSPPLTVIAHQVDSDLVGGHNDIVQLQNHVRALEAQLACMHRQDAASQDVAATLRRRDEECFELHRKLEMQQQQLEDMASENKMLLQAISHKSAQADSSSQNQQNHQLQQQQQQQQALDDLRNQLLACQSELEASNAAAIAAADALTAQSSTFTSQIEAQARTISRMEADMELLKTQHAEAENSRQAAVMSRQAALASAASHETEVHRLTELLNAAEERDRVSTQSQEQVSLKAPTVSSELADSVHQLESDFAIKDQQREAIIVDLKLKLAESADVINRLQSSAQREQVGMQPLQLEVAELQQQIALLQDTISVLKSESASSTVACQVAVREKEVLGLQLQAASQETMHLQAIVKQQQELHQREISELNVRCDGLALKVNDLQSKNDLLSADHKQNQHRSTDKELSAAKRELEEYAQGESKLLLELNRRLGLARRCSELSYAALASLSKCGEVGTTPIASVDEQPVAAVSPSSALSVLGKYLDNLVVKLMDLKKASETLSASVPAMKHDCDRMMSKIVDLERLRAEWSESQGELLQAKSALAKTSQQLQIHSQLESSVLSLLQSCSGSAPGEHLQQAATRITDELKTARMTISELARQVEVERSSSSSRNRAADSQGNELRSALAAADQRHATELSSVKAQLRKSELQCQQTLLDLQAANKLNSELNEQVSVFESVLAEKDAEVAEVSQQLQLARALVTSLSEQAEVAVNLELVRARKRVSALETQLQEAHEAKVVLEADIKELQSLPARIRDLEVALAKKERELSLLQVATAQAQEQLRLHSAHNSSGEFMVDRRLVTNLLVQYVVGSASRKAEVLKLMAQVLEFDAETQQRVGLSGKGWMTWLSGSQTQTSVETQNIGDMWVKFLLESAKPDARDAADENQ